MKVSELMAGYTPVSYTHLDVYKRQGKRITIGLHLILNN